MKASSIGDQFSADHIIFNCNQKKIIGHSFRDNINLMYKIGYCLVLIIFVSSYKLYAQNSSLPSSSELAIRVGSFFPTEANPGSQFAQSFSTGLSYSKNFNISKSGKQWLNLGFGMQSLSTVSNYSFVSSQNSNQFLALQTGANFNRLRLYAVDVPVAFRQVLFQQKGNAITFNLGLVSSYFFDAYNKVIASEQSTQSKGALDNHFQFCPNLEISSLNIQPSKLSLLWGVGAAWQTTAYLSNSQSFKPLSIYFKLGIHLKK